MACGAVQIGVKKRTRPARRLQKTMSRTAVPRQRPKTPPPRTYTRHRTVHRRTRSSSPYGFRRQKKQPRTVCYKRPRKRLVNLYACDCGEVFCYEALRATSPRQGGAKSELSRGFPLKKCITKSRNSIKPHA